MLDSMLQNFDGNEPYTVSLHLVINILEQIESDSDWSAQTFIGFLEAILAENSSAQAQLIVRRGRDIAEGTGTLLSENDRKLGDSITDTTVLTMYKVTGNKGWNGKQIWIPNIKLPSDKIYYGL